QFARIKATPGRRHSNMVSAEKAFGKQSDDEPNATCRRIPDTAGHKIVGVTRSAGRSEEHTSELQSLRHLVCRLLLEKKKNHKKSSKIWRHENIQFKGCQS